MFALKAKPGFAATFNEGKDMKIRESLGQSVWNHSENGISIALTTQLAN